MANGEFLENVLRKFSCSPFMKTGKETKPAGNIHRQQLFYWMGRSIDEQNGKRRLLREELAQMFTFHLTVPSLPSKLPA